MPPLHAGIHCPVVGVVGEGDHVPLAQRLKVEPPEMQQRQQFLEDLLAAEYRRQSRQLG